jgi:hypothetical protein
MKVKNFENSQSGSPQSRSCSPGLPKDNDPDSLIKYYQK